MRLKWSGSFQQDALTLDFGCLYNHYVSDMTRTIYGDMSATKEKEKFTKLFWKPISSLIDAAKDGLGFRDFDKIPRDVIEGAGLWSLYHGIGHMEWLDIHEEPLQPNV